MKITEQPCGRGSILSVLSYPDGPTLYRPQGPWGVVTWYTTAHEALEVGLRQWKSALGYYERDCPGQRTATEKVAQFTQALAAEKEAPCA